MTSTGFDVREYAATAHGSLRDRVDLDRLPSLGEPGRELISALGVIEGATMRWLRSVLVTATHKDASVTAFLVTWAYEKYWISDVLALLAGGGAVAEVSGRERGTVGQAVRGMLDGADIVAAHLACIRESDRMLETAYRSLAADEPALVPIIEAVLGIKARQASYLDEQIGTRVAASARAGRLVRRELGRWPLPIGVDALPEPGRAALESAMGRR